jgi:peptide deformylase
MFRKVITMLSPEGYKELKQTSKSFPAYDSWTNEDHQDLKDLYETFDVLSGYGLAAPQIGIHKRAIAVDLEKLGVESSVSKVVMVNPVLKTWGPKEKSAEACFSVPHVSAFVERDAFCSVTYYSVKGDECVLEVNGYASACLQHEIDHLDGILYLHRISSFRGSMLSNKSKKIEKKKRLARNEARLEFEKEHMEIMGTPASQKPQMSFAKRKKVKARRKKDKQNRRRNRGK